LQRKKLISGSEKLLERTVIKLKRKSGGGILSYEVWGYQQGKTSKVTRYNLAYINHEISKKDHGRVLGYDNAHDYHHRHYMGAIEPVSFESYEQILERFQEEWALISTEYLRGKK
jgi:hypothetical protein